MSRARMGEPPSSSSAAPRLRRQRRSDALLGLTFVLLGVSILLGLEYITNASNPAAEGLMFALGLGLISLISAAAQVVGVIGLAMLWRAWRPGKAL